RVCGAGGGGRGADIAEVISTRTEEAHASVTSVAQKWVSEAAGLHHPSRVVWCDGSKAEYASLIEAMLRDGTLLPLNSKTYPNCYLPPSHPSATTRTPQLT